MQHRNSGSSRCLSAESACVCERDREKKAMPMQLLIIPIIMAHYENLINNTEDIVVAISHMVVGLYSVTI